MTLAAVSYVYVKISPEIAKAADNRHITLAQLVVGSHQIETGEKPEQIECRVVKQVQAE